MANVGTPLRIIEVEPIQTPIATPEALPEAVPTTPQREVEQPEMPVYEPV
jgi:hypothetical protein